MASERARTVVSPSIIVVGFKSLEAELRLYERRARQNEAREQRSKLSCHKGEEQRRGGSTSTLVNKE